MFAAISFNALEGADTNKKIFIFGFAVFLGLIMGGLFFHFEKITTIAAGT